MGTSRVPDFADLHLPTGSGIPPFSANRADVPDQDRLEEIWELGVLGGAAAIPVLRTALTDHDVEVRREAVWALARIGSLSTIPALKEALGDSDPEVRGMASEVLVSLERKYPSLASA